MQYIQAVFWVESSYDVMDGWKEKTAQEGIIPGVKQPDGNGWEVTDGRNGNAYPAAKKNEERLELHPQYLGGVIQNDSPKKIAKLLSLAKTFQYKRIEVLSAVEGLSATRYLLKLKEQQKDMMEDIKGFCRTETGNGFATVSQLYSVVERKYHLVTLSSCSL
jgi:hypothetical protein